MRSSATSSSPQMTRVGTSMGVSRPGMSGVMRAALYQLSIAVAATRRGDLACVDIHHLGRHRQPGEHAPHRGAAGVPPASAPATRGIWKKAMYQDLERCRQCERGGAEAERVRHVHDDQAFQRAHAAGGEAPGDHRAPVMADQGHVPGA